MRRLAVFLGNFGKYSILICISLLLPNGIKADRNLKNRAVFCVFSNIATNPLKNNVLLVITFNFC